MRLASAVLALVAVGPALAQPAKPDKVITVTGTATVYAKPDTARIHYGVRASEPAVDAVKDVLAKTTKAMDEAVKKLKLPNLTVTAAPLSIRQVQANPNLGQVPGGGAAPAPGIGPFSANAAYTATLTDADPEKLRVAVEAFVKAVTETGANTPGDDKETNLNVFGNQETTSGPKIILSRADESAARGEALQKAVEKALKDARAIAKGLNAGDVTVVSVTEGDGDKPATPDTFASIYGMEAPGPRTQAGVVEVKVKVLVKCSY